MSSAIEDSKYQQDMMLVDHETQTLFLPDSEDDVKKKSTDLESKLLEFKRKHEKLTQKVKQLKTQLRTEKEKWLRVGRDWRNKYEDLERTIKESTEYSYKESSQDDSVQYEWAGDKEKSYIHEKEVLALKERITILEQNLQKAQNERDALQGQNKSSKRQTKGFPKSFEDSQEKVGLPERRAKSQNSETNKTTSNGNNGQQQTVPKSDPFQEQDLSDKIPEITEDEERWMKRINELDTLRGQLKALDEEKKKLQDEISRKDVTILQPRDDIERRPERPKSAYPTDHRDKRECERHCNELDALKGKLKHYEHLITSLKEEKLNNEKTIIGLRDENNELLNRLSKIASDNPTHTNTDIPDLSDESRPSKLTEKMSELYDNQWTSAFDEMKTNGFEDENAIGILLKIVMETNQVCKDMAFSHYRELKEACTRFECSTADVENKEKVKIFTMDNISIEMKQDIKRIWRESSKKVLKQVIKIIGRKVAEKFDIPLLQMTQTTLYMQECAELCWMMNIQEKPMHLDISVSEKDGHKYFDTEKYRSYTKTGQHVAFVLWPALYLFEGGSLLKKGVAQGLMVAKDRSGQKHSSVPRS